MSELFSVLLATATAVSSVAVVLAALSWRRTQSLVRRLDAFLQGRDGISLEALLAEQRRILEEHDRGLRDLVSASEYLHQATQSSLRKVAFERYNPFPGVGGNQSFTLVLLDASNTGVVLTSLHNRESTRVYAKAIRQGKPLQNLSEEEERALKNAMLQKGA